MEKKVLNPSASEDYYVNMFIEKEMISNSFVRYKSILEILMVSVETM